MIPVVDAFLADEPDPLIKRGRYQIVPEGAKAPKAHTRITNFAKKLEDEYSLTRWKLRQVLLGVAQRSDIGIAALAAGDNVRDLDELAEAAMDAAKANVKRETGTALHRLCERLDAGEKLDLPEPWKSDLAAYQWALADIGATVELIEAVVVCPRLALAGRLDRTVLLPSVDAGGPAHTRYVLDLKTGDDLSYSWGSIAMQLALYAGAATVYDPATKRHTPMPECDQDRAIVIHLPAGKGVATPYWVDIATGRRGIELVTEVLEWRKGSRQLASLTPQPTSAPRPEQRDYAEARVRFVIEAGHGDDLARAWPADVPTLKSADDHNVPMLDAIVAVCDAIEARHKLPFPDVDSPLRVGGF